MAKLPKDINRFWRLILVWKRDLMALIVSSMLLELTECEVDVTALPNAEVEKESSEASTNIKPHTR